MNCLDFTIHLYSVSSHKGLKSNGTIILMVDTMLEASPKLPCAPYLLSEKWHYGLAGSKLVRIDMWSFE